MHMHTHGHRQELPKVIAANFGTQVAADTVGICGHSMGGHGALTIAMKNPVRTYICAVPSLMALPTAASIDERIARSFTTHLDRLQVRLGLRAHRAPERLPLGRQGLHGLFGRGPRGLGGR